MLGKKKEIRISKESTVTIGGSDRWPKTKRKAETYLWAESSPSRRIRWRGLASLTQRGGWIRKSKVFSPSTHSTWSKTSHLQVIKIRFLYISSLQQKSEMGSSQGERRYNYCFLRSQLKFQIKSNPSSSSVGLRSLFLSRR